MTNGSGRLEALAHLLRLTRCQVEGVQDGVVDCCQGRRLTKQVRPICGANGVTVAAEEHCSENCAHSLVDGQPRR
eukprot:CAMPEP_0194286766 /NCGR_PEP_ID=MMETSP0169-20130528/33264_1 /TAXON_ID=218684 /ORGANISM="Corethron pennatum, Strain L29A3" /LENGTH=74 /DNA_ID=CAMNT_0039033279 /DNA_START=33 /DNA_END=257 /DNA_ORIENTATION=+